MKHVIAIFMTAVAPSGTYGVKRIGLLRPAHSTYLNWWLRYCGIDEIHKVRVQPTYPGVKFTKHRERAVA